MDRKVAIVTGGNRGIGYQISKVLCESGYFVISVSKTDFIPPDFKWARAWNHIVCDLSNCFEIDGLPLIIKGFSAKVDVLINNAGVAQAKRILDISEEDWDEIFSVNVKASWYMIKKFVPMMEIGSSIINISSVSGLSHFTGHSHYCASKWALEGLKGVAAKELSSLGIRVNNVAPGPTDTDMFRKLDDEYSEMNNWDRDLDYGDKYFGKLLVKRMGRPEDVSDVVMQILDNDYMTGVTIPICGGNILR